VTTTHPSRPKPGAPARLTRPPAPTRGLASVSRLSSPRTDGPVPLEAVQGTLALDLRGLPAEQAQPLPHLAVAVDADAVDAEVRIWAHRFAQAVVEVTGGDRPLTQLLRWTSVAVYQDLGRRVQIMAQTRSAPQRRRTIRPQVRSVHVFQPGPMCAEVSVHVRYGLRSRAIAARLERRRGSWTCTVLQLG
jgi:uncharacterized protein DUF6459